MTLGFVAVATVVMAACGGGDDEPDVRQSGIAGIVRAGPQCPVMMAGSPCPDKPLEATLRIAAVGDGFTATVESDSDGLFRLDLPPGEYEIVALPIGDGPFPAPPGDQVVTVRSGAITEVPISYDTGIR